MVCARAARPGRRRPIPIRALEIASKIPGSQCRRSACLTPVPGIYELLVARRSLMSRPTASTRSPAICSISTQERQSDRDARRDIAARSCSRCRAGIGDAGVRATRSEVHGHRVHRCRLRLLPQLHSQISEYNRLGIRVRYLFYPRTGPEYRVLDKAEEVWCAKDRNDALTRPSGARSICRPKACRDTPVARDYALGQELGMAVRRRSSWPMASCLAATCRRPSSPSACASSSRSASIRGRRPLQRFELALSLSGLPSHSLASAGGGPSSR